MPPSRVPLPAEVDDRGAKAGDGDSPTAKAFVDDAARLERLRKVIRLRHYARSTTPPATGRLTATATATPYCGTTPRLDGPVPRPGDRRRPVLALAAVPWPACDGSEPRKVPYFLVSAGGIAERPGYLDGQGPGCPGGGVAPHNFRDSQPHLHSNNPGGVTVPWICWFAPTLN